MTDDRELGRLGTWMAWSMVFVAAVLVFVGTDVLVHGVLAWATSEEYEPNWSVIWMTSIGMVTTLGVGLLWQNRRDRRKK